MIDGGQIKNLANPTGEGKYLDERGMYVTLPAGGSSLTYSTLPDAPTTLSINNAYKLQATTLTANRIFTMPTGTTDGELIEIFNANTTDFEATLAGSAVYYWNEIDTLTTLDAGVYYKFLWLDGNWIVQNLT